jgi:hypothetical protein
LKLDNGCCGRGIRLVQTAAEAAAALPGFEHGNVVASRYLSRPLLIGGLKFDLRIYVLVRHACHCRADSRACQNACLAKTSLAGRAWEMGGHPIAATRCLLIQPGFPRNTPSPLPARCCAPLRVFLYREGLARFCTEPYAPPCLANLDRSFMHLSNYAVNKHNPDFVFNRRGWVPTGNIG